MARATRRRYARILIRRNGPRSILTKSVCVCECEPPANSESLVRLGGIRITLEMSVYAVGGRTRRRVYTTSINQRASKRQRGGTHTHAHTETQPNVNPKCRALD